MVKNRPRYYSDRMPCCAINKDECAMLINATRPMSKKGNKTIS